MPATANRNLIVAAIAGGAALAMIGVAYAAVPLYFAFCRATGFAGTTQVAEKASGERGHRGPLREHEVGPL